MNTDSLHQSAPEEQSLVDVLGPLPKFVYDLYGSKTELIGVKWRVHNFSVTAELLNWEFFNELVPGNITFAVQHFIADTIGINKMALSTAINRFHGLRKCFKIGGRIDGLADLTIDYALRVKSELDRLGPAALHQFIYFRLFYYWASDRGLPGTDPQTADQIESIGIPYPKTHSEPVLTRDPNEGPLTDEERFALERFIRENPDAGFEQTVLMTFIELGYNPKNLGLLEERDYVCKRSAKNPSSVVYGLMVPRIKKRNNKRETVARDITEQLGQALERMIAANQARFGDPDPKRPIFCRFSPREKFLGTPRERFVYHSVGSDLSRIISEFCDKRSIISPRTGELLHLTPRRLRYTYGTRMAELGTPPTQLACLMDHSNERSVMSYYKSSPRIVERLDKSVGERANPVWRWFLGQGFIERKGNDAPGTLISGITPTYKNVGSLGKCGAKVCGDGLNPPLTCYVCPKYHPFVDGPHRQYLDEVRAYKKELLDFAADNPAYPIPSALFEIERAIEEAVRIQESARATKLRSRTHQ
jgi:hypothetical protein